jgi:ArsR family transcriptional regulator
VKIYANIRAFVYTDSISDSLRRFKAEVFQALGHPTRIAIVELLRDESLPAGKLIERLGIEQANVSQHLSVLRSKKIVLNRKVGNQVFYSLRDPILSEVLDLMRRYFQAHISGTLAALGEIEESEVRRQ